MQIWQNTRDIPQTRFVFHISTAVLKLVQQSRNSLTTFRTTIATPSITQQLCAHYVQYLQSPVCINLDFLSFSFLVVVLLLAVAVLLVVLLRRLVIKKAQL